MLNTSKPESDVVTSSDETPVDGASAVLEAPTAEAALGAVHERFGPDARVIDARRVLRGGVRGFFAKEHVQLHVAPGPADGAAAGSSAGGGAVGPDESDNLHRRSAGVGSSAGGGAVGPDESDNLHRRSAGAGTGAGPETGSAAGAGVPAADGSPVSRLLAAGPDTDDSEDFGSYLRRTLASTLALESQRHAAAEGASPAAGSPSPDGATRRQADELWAAASATSATTATSHDSAPAAVATTAGIANGDAQATAPPGTDELQPPAWPRISADEATLRSAQAAPAADESATGAAPMPVEAAEAGESTTRPAPAPVAVAASARGGHPDEPAWSHTALIRTGLPAGFFHDLDPRGGDDLGWTTAVAEAVGPLCRPLPSGPGVLIGPGADELTEVAGLPAARSGTWLSALGADRWRHLVIGGDGWRDQLGHDPLAVSWTRPEYLAEAVRCAAELGLVLGYGPLDGRLRRVRPLDLALAIRASMERS